MKLFQLLFFSFISTSLIAQNSIPKVLSVEKFAGTTSTRGDVNGQKLSAQFNEPIDMAITSAGVIYLAEENGSSIKTIDINGIVSDFVGSSGDVGFIDGTGASARFNQIRGIALDGNGNIIVADKDNHAVRKVTPAGVVTTIAGNVAGFQDGSSSSALFNKPVEVLVDNSNNIYVADALNYRVRRIDSNGNVSTVAGTGTSGYLDGNVLTATLDVPTDFAFDSKGDLIIVTYHAVRRLNLTTGTLSTIVGSATATTHTDGNKDVAGFGFMNGLLLDEGDVIYVVDRHSIRHISQDGFVTTITGNAVQGVDNGSPLSSRFNFPRGIVKTSEGHFLVADKASHVIRRVNLDRQAPVFTSSVVTSFLENGTGTVYTASATDASTITYSLGTSNDEGQFNIDGNSGVVTFKVAPDFEAPADANADNVYVLGIKATDGANTSSITIQIQVANVQEFNPIFSTTSVTGINEGTDYKYEAKATDADNTGLFINVTTKPGWIDIEPDLEVTTLAGKLPSNFKNGSANDAVFNQPQGLTFDNAGNLYVADALHNQIRKVSPDGTVSTFAGTGLASFKDGPVLMAGFNNPTDVVFDSNGNLYVVDRNNHAIRKIDTNGNVTTVAGNGRSGLLDGKGVNGQFDLPNDFAFDSSENLFVTTSTRIKKVDQAGNVTTFFGGGNGDVIKNGSIDRLRNPLGMAIDKDDNLYFGESNGLITKVTSQGVGVTFAGTGTPGFQDGVGTNAQIGSVSALMFTSSGDLYFSDANNFRVRKVTPDGTVSTVAGNGSNTGTDGPIGTASIEGARGLAIRSNGDIYFTDGSRKVRRVTTGGTVEFVAGKAIVSGSQGNDGLGTNATFSFPNRSAVDSNGNLYVTDQSTGIRKITPEGLVTTFSKGFTGSVFDIFIDDTDQIFYTDVLSNVIRKLNSDGTSTLVFGKEGRGFADGNSIDALFSNPYGLVIDSNGNFFVADQLNHRIRKITPSGIVSTFAGSTSGHQDGNGSQALFTGPSGLTIDKDDNLYVADRGNSRIRKITPVGIVTTIAGSGTSSQNLDGLGTSASFVLIDDIDIDKSGNLWVAGGNVIRIISPSGRVTTVAGTGQAAFRNGKGSEAEFFSLQGIEVADGVVYVTDRGNSSIRKISHSGITLNGNTGGQAGDHNIVIEATDQQGAMTKQEFTLSVFANGDFAPVFTSGLSQNFLTLTTGTAYQAIATDTKAITYQLGTNNDEALFDIDASNGNLNFKIPPNFSSPQDSNNDNKYLVEVIANNGTRSTSQIVTISVIAQIVNAEPVITSNPVTSITDNTSYRYEIKVNDPENDVTTVSSSTLPSWMSLEQQPLGTVTTFAGSGVSGTSDGTGLAAQFNLPLGLTIDQSDNIYVAELTSKTIRKISPTGEVTTFVGSASNFTEKDGTGSDAGFSGPIGMASDALGNLYVSDNTTSSIRKITPSGVVTTIAGTGVRGYMDGTGAAAQFSEPKDLAVDSKGNIFIADHGNDRIRKITPTGLVTTFAGSGERKLIDGVGTSAAFNRPFGITIDGSDNLYVADNNNHSIRKITPTGIVTTIAGNGVEGYVDDTGAAARFDNPAHLSSDAVGNLYVADFGNKRIRKVTVDGKVTTLAGSGVDAKTDGTGSEAAFNGLFGIVLDSKGDLFISESSSRVIRKMVISGTLPVLIGNTKGQAGSHEVTIEATDTNNGKAIQSFTVNISNTGPVFMPLPNIFPLVEENSAGTVFTAKAQDSDNIKYVLGSNFDESFFTIDQSTGVLTFKNAPDFENPLDSDKNNSYLAQIYAFDDRSNSANILVRALMSNVDDQDPSFTSVPVTSVNDNANYEYVIKVEDQDGERLQVSAESLPGWLTLDSQPDGVTTTIAGSGEKKLLDGNGLSAAFSSPRDVAMDSEGNIFIVDSQNNAIRKMAVDGAITTFAGNGQQGSADGTGASATFNGPRAIVIDKDDNLYISDSGNNRIRKITKSGQVSTFAGSNGGFQDGQGTSAMFNSPRGLAIDANGVIYVADGFNSRIRTISPSGEVATLAGQGGFVYQDGTGTAAGFSFPQDVAVDNQGNVFVADWGNFSIRKITPSGVVTTIAGLPDNLGSQNHPSEDGIVTAASLNGPQGIVVDKEGNIYVTESRRGNVRRVTPGGIVTTVAGNDIGGYADGTGPNALFNSPDGILIDKEGNLLIADAGNNRIRKVTLGQAKLTGSAVGQSGDHSVALKVNDAEGAAVMQTFTITVNDLTKPVFTSGLSVSVKESTTLPVYTAKATDANALIYGLGNLKDESNFNINGVDGSIRFNTQQDFENPVDANSDNVYILDVTASDGTNTATQEISITVTNVDEGSLSFISEPTTTVSRDENYRYLIETTSPNGNLSSISGTNLPPWLSLKSLAEVTSSNGGGTAITQDTNGDFYILEDHQVKKIDQAGTITVIAGSGNFDFADGVGTSASFAEPSAIAIGPDGNIYVADTRNSRIRKVTKAGVVTTFAGVGPVGFDIKDGGANVASFVWPHGLAFDSQGNLFVSDSRAQNIRKIDPIGNVTTFAGKGIERFINRGNGPVLFDLDGGFADGIGLNAKFDAPMHIAIDKDDNLYLADSRNHKIRKINPNAEVTTIAGSTQGDLDGMALEAQFDLPNGVAVNSDGVVFVAQLGGNGRIKSISTTGTVVTVAGGNEVGDLDGIGTDATFSSPADIQLTMAGDLIVPDKLNAKLRRFRLVEVLTGNPFNQVGTYNISLSASNLEGQSASQDFTLEVKDTNSPSLSEIVRINPADQLIKAKRVGFRVKFNEKVKNVSAEDFGLTGLGGTISSVVKDVFEDSVYYVNVDVPNGSGKLELNLLPGNDIVDLENNQVSSLNPIGTREYYFIRPNNAPSISSSPLLFVNDNENYNYPLSFNDPDFDRLLLSNSSLPSWLKLTTNYTVSTLAGSVRGFQDGLGSEAKFRSLSDITTDREGNVFVTELGTKMLKKVTPQGLVTSFVSLTGRETDPSGGVTGTQLDMTAITADNHGNLIVAGEYRSNSERYFRIERISSRGERRVIAGGPGDNFVNGQGSQATFKKISDLAIDNSGNIIVADEGNHLIRKVTQVGVVTTIAGSVQGFQDGTSNEARFSIPRGVTVDSQDNIFVVDYLNNRIRKIDNNGTVITFAGSEFGDQDGQGTSAKLGNLFGIAIDSNDNIYVTQNGSKHNIRKIDSSGKVTTIAGSTSGFQDGSADSALFNAAIFIVVDNADNIIVADLNNFRLRKISKEYTLSGSAIVQKGNQIVDLVVSDDFGGQDQQRFAIKINDVTKPVFTSGETISFTEKSATVAYTALATDTNTITYSLGSANDEGLFSINAINGDVTFKVPPVFDTPSDANADNIYVLEVIANDGSNVEPKMVTINVRPLDDIAPVFTSVATSDFLENSTSTAYQAMATDVNAITYSLGTSNDEAHLNIDAASGEITFKSSPNFEDPKDANTDNSYILEIIATDGRNTTKQLVTIKVNNVSDVKPVFTSNPVTNAKESEEYRYFVEVSDLEGERVTLSTSNLPDWLSLKSSILGEVTTVAGNLTSTIKDGTGLEASLNTPGGGAFDSKGNFYVADQENDRIVKITSDGLVTTFAGTGIGGFKDGPKEEAMFNAPIGVVVDSKDNLFVADAATLRVRKIDQAGNVTTFAGSGESGSINGIGVNASFRNQRAIAIDAQDNIYVADQFTIRKITPVGEVSLFVGDPNDFGTANGSHEVATFGRIGGLTFDKEGNLYASDVTSHRIRKITPGRVVSDLAGSVEGFTDGVGQAASFRFPYGLAYGADDHIYVTDAGNAVVRKISLDGTVSGHITTGGLFEVPRNLAFDQSGNLFVIDYTTGIIYKAANENSVQPFAGGTRQGFDDGLGSAASFERPFDVATDKVGNIYVSDSRNHAVRKVDVNGVVSTLAGTGQIGNNDGSGSQATFNDPLGIAVDKDGNVYVADSRNKSVRKISPIGVVSTIAGATEGGGSSPFKSVVDVAVSSDGTVYVADEAGHQVFKVDLSGEVTVFAGDGVFRSRDGQGQSASISLPRSMAIDKDGNLYIIEGLTSWLRKIDSEGNVTTALGNNENPVIDIKGAPFELVSPSGLAISDEGVFFMADQTKQHIVKVDGRVAEILAGSGIRGASDEIGTNASFSIPRGVALDPYGNVIVADLLNHRIRRVSSGKNILSGNPLGQSGDHLVTVLATDEGGNTSEQSFSITIIDDIKPVLTSGTIVDFVENGTGTAYTAVAIDANAITYSLGTGNDEGLFDIDGSTGAVTFKAVPDFESPADANTDNAYVLEVKASDGVNTVSLTVTITVTDVDDTDPVFTSATTASFVENGTGTAYTAVATDANAITYSLGTSNDESLFDIDGSTGAVTFKSSPDFESPADGNTDNAYVLEVKASDGI
ncbi:SMP-30/gluconolactonase/LRE family protein, partial [Roseivirga sp. E12]|uniref:NHL domain-containing protein n=1 Tax=Roseivirga sp. E12 TaxID=2819237 RepID=UPI001ABCB9F5